MDYPTIPQFPKDLQHIIVMSTSLQFLTTFTGLSVPFHNETIPSPTSTQMQHFHALPLSIHFYYYCMLPSHSSLILNTSHCSSTPGVTAQSFIVHICSHYFLFCP